MRVLLAVHFLTACYSRVSDRVYVAQIAKVARLDEHRTQKALAFWHRVAVIEWHGSPGRGRASWVSLPYDVEKTRQLPNAVRSDLAGNPGQFCDKNPVSSDPPTEKVFREVVREGSSENAGAAFFKEGETFNPADPLTRLVGELRERDELTERTFRGHLGSLPEAAFAHALDELRRRRRDPKRERLVSEAKYVFAILREWAERAA